jgi:hypothetical protein
MVIEMADNSISVLRCLFDAGSDGVSRNLYLKANHLRGSTP